MIDLRRTTDHDRERPAEFWAALAVALASGVVLLVGIAALIAMLS